MKKQVIWNSLSTGVEVVSFDTDGSIDEDKVTFKPLMVRNKKTIYGKSTTRRLFYDSRQRPYFNYKSIRYYVNKIFGDESDSIYSKSKVMKMSNNDLFDLAKDIDMGKNDLNDFDRDDLINLIIEPHFRKQWSKK
jgi:hypothetical protein